MKVRHYLLDIPDVGRNHILLFFPLKIISVREIYSDSLFLKNNKLGSNPLGKKIAVSIMRIYLFIRLKLW